MIRPDNLKDVLDSFYVVHGRAGAGWFIQNKNFHSPKFSKDLFVVTVTSYPDENPYYTFLFNETKDTSIHRIISQDFECMISKIEILIPVLKARKEKYTLWVDYSDTVIPRDIMNPEEILNFYNAKIVFNAEDGYHEASHPCIDDSYITQYWEEFQKPYRGPFHETKLTNVNNLKSKTGLPYERGLNSGVFLGERVYIIDCLTEMLSIMKDNYKKGYPYGDKDDQNVWRYIMANRSGIEIDYLNKFFIWVHDRKYSFPIDSWEHYDFFNRSINEF